MKILTFIISLFSCLAIPFFALANEETLQGKVYDAIVNPVLQAKCVSCHGQDKDKGKLRMHTKTELIKGGRGAGSAIIVKGDIDESELIFRITLPKDDEEAMPPMEDESHYNPVTSQELSVLQSWIRLGASFDMLIKDLDDVGKKAAEHVLKNLPVKKLSATALLIPKLPEVAPANKVIVEELKAKGVLVMPIAQNTNALYVNASYTGKSFDDESIKMLLPLAPQLVWLNLARTSVTDSGMELMSKLFLLERLHAENTDLGDKSSINISKLTNLKYLNMYGTKISDVSINNFQKLQKLEKVFLWQTNVTENGADSLRKSFIDPSLYSSLSDQKRSLEIEKGKIANKYSSEITNLEDEVSSVSKNTSDASPINEKCPVSNKNTDKIITSNFEGRKIGFCCETCKSKFVKDGASFRSKLGKFQASTEFENALSKLTSKRLDMDNELERIGAELRNVSRQLSSLGPQINLGWTASK
ncbi:hypothetical protein N8920_07355 [Opitutales bacterium]|nr:hypothetical protein [bacterium]MDA7757702.1 hypothetical protein [Opitutales bacterium]